MGGSDSVMMTNEARLIYMANQIARNLEGTGHDDGDRRQEHADSGGRDAGQARVLREILRASPAGGHTVTDGLGPR